MRDHDSETMDTDHRSCWYGLKSEQDSERAGHPSIRSKLYVTVCDPTRRSRSPIAHMSGERTFPLQQLTGREDGLRVQLAKRKEIKRMQDFAKG